MLAAICTWNSQDLETLYGRIQDVGAPLGLVDFGSYALNAMRIEKGYHGWGTEFGTEYTPFDCGLERFIAFDKPNFVGREAVLTMRDKTPDWTWVGFEVEGADADPLPSDAITSGENVVGYVTSSTTGFRTGKRIALGYIKHSASRESEFEVSVLGKQCRGVRCSPQFYDPTNSRLSS